MTSFTHILAAWILVAAQALSSAPGTVSPPSGYSRGLRYGYLDKHPGQYTGFIIGTPSASVLDPTEITTRRDSYYNLASSSCRPEDYVKTAFTLIHHYSPSSILLAVGLPEASLLEAGKAPEPRSAAVGGSALLSRPRDGLVYRYEDTLSVLPFFSQIHPETGCYDRTAYDCRRISQLQHDFKPYECGRIPPLTPEYTTSVLNAVSQIDTLCRSAGVTLTVVFMPGSREQLKIADATLLQSFRSQLAAITDYWDFAFSPISDDPRFFYSGTHIRSAVGAMLLDRVFHGKGFIPEDFGSLVKKGTEPKPAPEPAAAKGIASCKVPVLMYHHITEGEVLGASVSRSTFVSHMKALKAAGYNTVSVQQLLDYVDAGIPLPERPVCITFDDGYLSNYQIAFPILKEYQMKATIFAIGSSVGADTYKETGISVLPHFSHTQWQEMLDSGLITVQCHTYDMHQWEPYEKTSPVWPAIIPAENVSLAAFVSAIRADCGAFRDMMQSYVGMSPIALAYPRGFHSDLTEAVLHQEGIRITFTSSSRQDNILIPGLPQSLYALNRLNVSNDMTADDLLNHVKS